MATTAPRLLETLASKTWCNFGDILLLHRSSCRLGARLMKLFLHEILPLRHGSLRGGEGALCRSACGCFRRAVRLGKLPGVGDVLNKFINQVGEVLTRGEFSLGSGEGERRWMRIGVAFQAPSSTGRKEAGGVMFHLISPLWSLPKVFA